MAQTATSRQHQLARGGFGRIARVLAHIIVLCVFVAACGGGLQGINGSEGINLLAGIGVQPRQVADYSSFLINNSGKTVTLASATLLPTRGYKAPRLKGVAIELGRDFVAVGTGWPEPNDVAGKLAGFEKYRVPNGQRIQILYGVYADRAGNYADGGLYVTLRDASGDSAIVRVYGNATTCVSAKAAPCPAGFSERVTKTVRAQ